MASQVEIEAMRRAIELAARGIGTVRADALVGCVILEQAGNVAGEGFFERGGTPHAEVNALRQAGERAQGSTAVVTLEPCNHYGRTPPCTNALVEAGIARVVYAVADPNPIAAGGTERLRAAGIEVERGVLEAEAERVNEVWLTAVRLGRPFVIWKYVTSLDGRVAAMDGSSRSLACIEARTDTHRLRAESDAVMVGSGTQRVDDPHLAVHLVETGRRPLRIVVDSNARTPGTARVLDDAAPTLIAVAEDADADRLRGRAEVLRLPRAEAGLDLGALMKALHGRKVYSILLEGGPTLAGSFVAAGLVDRVIGYIASMVIGGGGLPALTGPGAPSIDKALRLCLDDVTRIGPDLRITARPQ